MHKKNFFFIVFEGIEGSGKSYQSQRLYKNIKSKKFPAILNREPGGTIGAERIRNIILKDYFHQDTKEKFHKYTDTLLYLAARNEHVQNKIKKAIEKKKIVICDRFIDSTVAYQHFGMGIDKILIDKLNCEEFFEFCCKKLDINSKFFKLKKYFNNYNLSNNEKAYKELNNNALVILNTKQILKYLILP